MDISRHGREWRMRWLTSPSTASSVALTLSATPTLGAAAVEDLCARCGKRGTWIAVPDLPSMPAPSAIFECPTCGTMTAHAEFRAKPRRIAD